jgi:hypothetical protein
VAWPIAAAVVLDLAKHNLNVSVQEKWLFMFGRTLASNGQPDAVLTFQSSTGALDAATGTQSMMIWAEGDVRISVQFR